MIFSKNPQKRKHELPFKSDITGWFLPVLISLMVFLSTITLAGLLSINSVLNKWNNDISGSLTVQIMPAKNTSSKKSKLETIKQQETTILLLKETKGIIDASPLSDNDLSKLIKPWLGDSVDINDLPVPRLIDVKLDKNIDIDYDKLAKKLSKTAPLASIDNHKLWLNKLIKLGDGLKALASSIFLLIILTTSVTIAYTTKTGLELHKNIIEILYLMGAKDTYIAQQYARRSSYLGFIGGLIGVLLSIPAIQTISSIASEIQGGIISQINMGICNWMLISLLPIFSSALATASAYCTVKRTLGKLA
jgi:cell division transport system permease protein